MGELLKMADKIIVISGKQYSGKDTAAKILLENLTNFKRIGLGDAIKIEYTEPPPPPSPQIPKQLNPSTFPLMR